MACWLGVAASAFAQAVEHQESAPVVEPERRPPGVIELPDIVLPDGAPAVESVTAIIVVSVEGTASLEESDGPPEIASVIADALSRARFSPATVNGEPVVARVRIVLRVAPPAPSSTTATPSTSPPIESDALPPNPFEEQEPASYQATARTTPVPPAARRMEIEEMRDVPGAFGDPFRILDTLPGVVPVFSGLPYVYVRGAPPASTSYVYDDIAIPLLFHFGIAAAVVHPAMLGDLLFYSSVAPARYGRKTGGVFGAEGPEVRDTLHGEVELRLIDVSAMLNVPVSDGGRVIAAARYGYPGLMLSLVQDGVTLAYWDYQLRVDLPLSERDHFQLAWFGSYDKVGETGDEITITFHRVEARLRHRQGDVELASALQLGFDQTGAERSFQVESARFGPRIWLTWTASTAARLRLGADMLATAGEIRNDEQRDDGMGGEAPSDDEPGLDGDPVSQRVKGRNMIGAYAELQLRPSTLWELSLGVRGDVWMTGTTQQHAVEPRVTATYHPTDKSDVYVAGGLSYQPAVFPIPIPGLADIVLDNGLQRAIQTEIGYRHELGDALRLETSLFFNHYSDLLFFDVIFDCSTAADQEACQREGFPRSTSDAYGWEVFLKRDSRHVISGWVSYTLGGARAKGPTGRAFVPETDVRHVGNVVLQAKLGKGWKLGLRSFYRSGRVASFHDGLFHATQRLPGFFRADVMISDTWDTSWGRMRLSLEWFNVTLSREAATLDCDRNDDGDFDVCGPEYAPALFFPNLGLRGEF